MTRRPNVLAAMLMAILAMTACAKTEKSSNPSPTAPAPATTPPACPEGTARDAAGNCVAPPTTGSPAPAPTPTGSSLWTGTLTPIEGCIDGKQRHDWQLNVTNAGKGFRILYLAFVDRRPGCDPTLDYNAGSVYDSEGDNVFAPGGRGSTHYWLKPVPPGCRIQFDVRFIFNDGVIEDHWVIADGGPGDGVGCAPPPPTQPGRATADITAQCATDGSGNHVAVVSNWQNVKEGKLQGPMGTAPLPLDGNGTSQPLNWVPGSYTATLVAKDGYTFEDGKTTTTRTVLFGVCTTPTPPGKLCTTKTPKLGSFEQGKQAVFTIEVSNCGPVGAASIEETTLVDQLPTNGGMTWTSVGIAPLNPNYNCGVTNGLLNCNLGTLAQGVKVTVTVKSPTTTPVSACQTQSNPEALAKAKGGLEARDSGSLSCTPAPEMCTPSNTIQLPRTRIVTGGADGLPTQYSVTVNIPAGANTAITTYSDSNHANPTEEDQSDERYYFAPTYNGTEVARTNSTRDLPKAELTGQDTLQTNVPIPATGANGLLVKHSVPNGPLNNSIVPDTVCFIKR